MPGKCSGASLSKLFIHLSVKPGQTGKLAETLMKTETKQFPAYGAIHFKVVFALLPHTLVVGWDCPKANNLPGGRGVEAGFKLCSV